MTVRTAEFVMAIVLSLCSIALMIKSAELNIGWIEGRGLSYAGFVGLPRNHAIPIHTCPAKPW